jgi:hypothetical protein
MGKEGKTDGTRPEKQKISNKEKGWYATPQLAGSGCQK